ncbi:hypothetical protein VSX61_12130 [Brenneria populi subsp. brevivirga]|uniref:STM2901 family protein n=1 Tax=Brenneria populi TaxID=1505588 RepID=UPI002E176869|nr:hypothetical protein [Brenneria populi subsp. brevivirga]
MDTFEQLHGKYFYGGLPGLSAQELLFWVLVDEVSEHFGAADILGAIAILSGMNTIDVPGKLSGARPGTSLASRASRRIFSRNKLMLPIRLPTIMGYPPNIEVIMTKKLGTFVGRTIPVLGWTVLAGDIFMITYKTITHYNLIVDEDDRLSL